MEIYERIRIIRQTKGYTQEYVAERLNIDTVNYGRIERGQAKLTIERFVKICDLLEVNPSDLFQRKEMNTQQNDFLLEKIYKEIKEINKKISV